MSDNEFSPEESAPQVSKEEAPLSTARAIGLFVFDFFKVFVIAVAIIIPIRWFLFQPFVVTGDSMRPNFHDGNYLIIDELTYRFRVPARGEVIVMRAPNTPSEFFIKRIVGLPGERVVVENGHVTVYEDDSPQGKILKEEYLPQENLTYGSADRRLGEHEYFVLGDNRLSSSDSRVWGPLQRDAIVGRAYIRVFPIADFQLFSTPKYQ